MKLRIKGNSIRFRLTKTDIDNFAKDGYVEERTEIGMNVFVYGLRTSGENTLTAKLDNNKIIMEMPDVQAQEWTNTEKVGYDAHIELPTGGKLYLLVEKDFKCLDDTVEDQSDNYDNPLLNK